MTQQNPFTPAQANPFAAAPAAAAPVAPVPVVAPQPAAAPAAAPVAVTQPPALPDCVSTGKGLDDPSVANGGHSTQLAPVEEADMQVDIVNVYPYDGHDSGNCMHVVFEVISSNNLAFNVGSRYRVFYRLEGTKNQMYVAAKYRAQLVMAIWGRTDSAFGRDAAEKWLLAPEQQAAFDAGTLRLPVSLRTYKSPDKADPTVVYRNEAWSPARR